MAKTFGEYLRQLREDRKMTLRDVEEKAKISNAYLSQVESGQRSTPTMKILSKLANVYGIPVATLMNKAMEELGGDKTKADSPKESKIPAPDMDFICRGYEDLSEEKKQTLKNFLQFLATGDKKK